MADKLVRFKDADGNILYPKIKPQSIDDGSITKEKLAEGAGAQDIKRGTSTQFIYNYGKCYLQMASAQVARLNKNTVMTLVVCQHTLQTNRGLFNGYYFYPNEGVKIWQDISALKVGNAEITNYGQPGCNLNTFFVVVDRAKGTAALYNDQGALLKQVQDSSIIADKFIGDDGKFLIQQGNVARAGGFYDIKLFDCDLFSLQQNDAQMANLLAFTDGVWRLPACFSDNYNLYTGEWFTFDKPQRTFGSNTTTAKDADGYCTVTATDKTNTKGTFLLWQNLQFMFSSAQQNERFGQVKAKQMRFKIEVLAGSMALGDGMAMGDGYLNTQFIQKVTDENGNEVADPSNCGAGTYIVDVTNANGSNAICKLNTTDTSFRYLSIDVRYCCCVMHLDFSEWHDGKKLHDDETGEYYQMYDDKNYTKEISSTNATLSSEPYRRDVLSNYYSPAFVGQKAYTGGKVYIAANDYTWKQINNA